MADRPEGFYWISDDGCAPEVAIWSEGCWWLVGSEEPAIATHVEVLGERLPPPAGPRWMTAEATTPARCGDGCAAIGLKRTP